MNLTGIFNQISGCDLLVYPAAFNLTTGSLYWTLLQRARATDNQLYVTCVSPSRNLDADYVAYGHTQLTDPYGKVIHEMDEHEGMFVEDIGRYYSTSNRIIYNFFLFQI